MLAQHREQIPMDVLQIDDAWQQQLAVGCPMNNSRWLAPHCAASQRHGARAGAWVAPLLVSQEVGKLAVHGSAEGLAERHPEWFQKRADGKPFNDGNGWGDPHSLLDPSHPDAARWLAREVGRLREDGMRYVKIDFNTFSEPRGWVPHHVRWHDSSRTRLEIFRDTWRLYREVLAKIVIF